MSAADPPSPVPEHLWPMVHAPLASGDLRVAPSTQELRTIAALLEHERLAGQLLVTMRDGSPWLELDVLVPVTGEARRQLQAECPGLAQAGVYRYAIWRFTSKAYRLDRDGAVQDDPIEL